MDHKKLIISSIIAILFVGVATTSAYSLVNRYAFNKLEKTAGEELEKGNYSSALLMYNKLKDSSEDESFAEQAEKTKNLLIAEENYAKALQLAEAEKWLDVEILLENSGALDIQEFKFLEESQALYEKAKNLVDSYEREVSDEISNLKQSVKHETAKRQQTESQLNTTISQKKQTEDTLQSTAQLLEQSQTKMNETQLQYEEEQRRAEEAERQAEKEKLDKFTNELNIYIGMLKGGNEQLNLAVAEINQSSADFSILFYIGQAEFLFDEAHNKSVDLRNNRTLAGFEGVVDKVTQSADLFNDAAQSFRKAVFYMGEDNDQFNLYFNEGNDFKMQAFGLANDAGSL